MIRSGMSFRYCFGYLPDVHARVLECGYLAAPIADVNSTFAYVRWQKLCREKGIKPVYGVTLSVVPRLGEKKPISDLWCFLAKDHLRPIHDLVALATANPGKEPSLTYDQALAREGVIRIAGERCRLDALGEPDADTYVALSPATPRGFYRQARERGHRFVACSANMYPRAEDLELYRVALGWRSGTQTYPQHILTDDEWFSAVRYTATREEAEAALGNRNDVLGRCRAEIKKAVLLSPPKPRTLRQMCVAGAKRTGTNLRDPIYRKRLDRELAMIADKKFEDYFYILADVMQFARSKMCCGPARGSSCGSLVCYLLYITAIDPVPYDLLFERFVDITRADLPDVDIDVSDKGRHLLFEYMEEKYGRDHVARLGTVGSFQPRSALAQAGAALQVPRWMVEAAADQVLKRNIGDSRASSTTADTLAETEGGRRLLAEYPEMLIAGRMEDHPTTAGQHAAGVVLTAEPVLEYVAVDSRTGATMCDKYDAEELGLLKIDALGLTQLSIFERTLELIGEEPRSAFLEALPLDDPKAFEVLNKRHFSGVFQYAGFSMISIAERITTDTFEDIVATTALCRPGPTGAGGTNSWVRRRIGDEPVTYPHPAFEPYMRDTLGVMIYQEQILRIGREVGDLSWDDVTALRKAMSKSLGKEFFDQYGDRWKAGAVKKGIPTEILDKIWSDMCNYGAWAFNRAHSVAYGVVSYWSLWLKAHHPVEFAAATLDAEKEPGRQIDMLRELAQEGVGYVPVDPERSAERWEVAERDGRKLLVGPLSSVRGIGPAGVAEILDCRRNGREIRPALAKRLAAARTPIDSLSPVADRIRVLTGGDLSTLNIVSSPLGVREVQPGVAGEVMILAVAARIVPLDENVPLRIQKRGYRIESGPTMALNAFFADDTDEVFCKVHRRDFERLARPIIDRGRPGKSIWAIKGTVPADFRMIWVKAVRYVGDMEDDADGSAAPANG